MVTAATKGDCFGESLSAGDTNGDGYQDLAVGVPEENRAGRVPAVSPLARIAR